MFFVYVCSFCFDLIVEIPRRPTTTTTKTTPASSTPPAPSATMAAADLMHRDKVNDVHDVRSLKRATGPLQRGSTASTIACRTTYNSNCVVLAQYPQGRSHNIGPLQQDALELVDAGIATMRLGKPLHVAKVQRWNPEVQGISLADPQSEFNP